MGDLIMIEPLVDKILEKISEVYYLYHRLILIVGRSGSGKTSALQGVSAKTSATIINVNLKLSRVMLDLTERQRVLQLSTLLSEIVNKVPGDVVLLDNMEILFHIQLQQDPLRLLKGLARNKTVVAAWNGSIVDGYLTYATPNHPEYRRYLISDLIIVNAHRNQDFRPST